MCVEWHERNIDFDNANGCDCCRYLAEFLYNWIITTLTRAECLADQAKSSSKSKKAKPKKKPTKLYCREIMFAQALKNMFAGYYNVSIILYILALLFAMRYFDLSFVYFFPGRRRFHQRQTHPTAAECIRQWASTLRSSLCTVLWFGHTATGAVHAIQRVPCLHNEKWHTKSLYGRQQLLSSSAHYSRGYTESRCRGNLEIDDGFEGGFAINSAILWDTELGTNRSQTP